MVHFRWAVFGAALLALLGTGPGNQAHAGVLSNGQLVVDIRNDNGALNSVVFGGSEFYRQGVFYGDYGFQVGTDTTTFRRNTINGITDQPVTVTSTAGAIVVTGTYTAGGANVAFERTYSLVPGLNVLRISTSFTNNGAPLTLSYYDQLEPDQGIDLGHGFNTFNDVFTLATPAGTARVGQSAESSTGTAAGPPGLTLVAGTLDPNATLSFPFDFEITNGALLNTFYSSPEDGNGAFEDLWVALGTRTLIPGGGTFTYVYDQAFGFTPDEAQAAFIAAQGGGPGVIPEPATITLLGIGTCTLAGYTWRRRKLAAR